MKKLIATLVLLMTLVTVVDAGTLHFKATAPNKNNVGTCGAPILMTNTDSVWVHYTVAGIVDSAKRAPGGVLEKYLTLPDGTYPVKVWAVRLGTGFRNVGCDTTLLIPTTVSTPGPVLVQP